MESVFGQVFPNPKHLPKIGGFPTFFNRNVRKTVLSRRILSNTVLTGLLHPREGVFFLNQLSECLIEKINYLKIKKPESNIKSLICLNFSRLQRAWYNNRYAI